jgi:hypothetical protein
MKTTKKTAKRIRKQKAKRLARGKPRPAVRQYPVAGALIPRCLATEPNTTS